MQYYVLHNIKYCHIFAVKMRGMGLKSPATPDAGNADICGVKFFAAQMVGMQAIVSGGGNSVPRSCIVRKKEITLRKIVLAK